MAVPCHRALLSTLFFPQVNGMELSSSWLEFRGPWNGYPALGRGSDPGEQMTKAPDEVGCSSRWVGDPNGFICAWLYMN